MVHGDVLRHAQREGGLTHCGACGEDYEVGVLPAGGYLVQLVEAAGDAAQAVAVRGRLLQHVVGFLDDGVDLRVVLFKVLLRNLEQSALGFLHEFVYVLRHVERLFFNVARIGDEGACRGFLRDDVGVILDVGRRKHHAAQRGDVRRAAGFLNLAHALQLIRDGKDIHGLVLDVEALDRFVNDLVARVVEALRLQNLIDAEIGVALYEQGADNGLFEVYGLRLQAAFRFGSGLAAPRAFAGIIWRHILLYVYSLKKKGCLPWSCLLLSVSSIILRQL